MLTPETVTPGVLYLVSEEAPSHTILAAGAGAFSVARIVEGESVWLKPEDQTPEGIAANWEAISSSEGSKALNAGFEQSFKMLTAAAEGLGINIEG